MIPAALAAASQAYADGERDAPSLSAAASAKLSACDALRVEYLEVVDPDAISATAVADDRSVMAIAAWLGPVRLIDNVTLAEGTQPSIVKTSTGAPRAAAN